MLSIATQQHSRVVLICICSCIHLGASLCHDVIFPVWLKVSNITTILMIHCTKLLVFGVSALLPATVPCQFFKNFHAHLVRRVLPQGKPEIFAFGQLIQQFPSPCRRDAAALPTTCLARFAMRPPPAGAASYIAKDLLESASPPDTMNPS